MRTELISFTLHVLPVRLPGERAQQWQLHDEPSATAWAWRSTLPELLCKKHQRRMADSSLLSVDTQSQPATRDRAPSPPSRSLRIFPTVHCHRVLTHTSSSLKAWGSPSPSVDHKIQRWDVTSTQALMYNWGNFPCSASGASAYTPLIIILWWVFF